MSEPLETIDLLRGCDVVLDVVSPFVFIGRVVGEDPHFIILENADAHDLRDSTTTREHYILDTRRHGIGANRRRVCVAKSQLVAISKLEDVIV